MRTSFLCLLVLAGLTTGLRAQIPNTWTQEKLKKVYDVPATIAYTKADIKSIAFTKKDPESFHGGECFSLIIMVLRGPGAPAVKAEDPNIKVTEKGDAITWTDRISGYSVSKGTEGFNFTARRNGKVQVTAKYDEIPHGSKFVLTDVGD